MIEDKDLDDDAHKAIASGEEVRREVLCEDGHLYERCVKPYRSAIGGVIVTYRPVSSANLPLGLEFNSRMEGPGQFSPENVIQSLAQGVTEIGVWTLQSETGQMDWDERFGGLTGLKLPDFSPDQSIFAQHIYADDRAQFVRFMSAMAEGGEAQDIELRFCPPQAEMIWLQMRSVRVDTAGGPLLVGIIADISERKGDKERSDFMMRELDHRVKNLLAIILSIAEITARSNNDIGAYKNDFRARLESMARTHNLLAQSQWSGLDLRLLVEEELHSLTTKDTVSISGDSLMISPVAAQSLAMFLHELAINALKHGALSNEDGHVAIHWEAEAGFLQLSWQEKGGPAVEEPKTEGFGGKVINRIVKRQLDADVKTRWDADGIKLIARISLANLAQSVRGVR